MPHWSSLASDKNSPHGPALASSPILTLLRALFVASPRERIRQVAAFHVPSLRKATDFTASDHNAGTLAGIFVGVLLAFILIITVCYYFYRKESLSEQRQHEPATLAPGANARFSRQMRHAQTSYYLCGHESYQNFRHGSRLLLATVDSNGTPIRLEAPRLSDVSAARRLVSTGGALVTFPPSSGYSHAMAPVTRRRRVHLYYRDMPPKGEEEGACMICLEPLKCGVIVSGECMHWTHEDCLKGWLAKSPKLDCPGCRAKLVESSEED